MVAVVELPRKMPEMGLPANDIPIDTELVGGLTSTTTLCIGSCLVLLPAYVAAYELVLTKYY